MKKNLKNILKHVSIISGLFILTIVGVLLFLFNAESDTTDILNEEHKTTTFTPFVKTANNSIVNRKQFELQKAIKVAKNEKDFALVRTSKDYNKDIPFTIDEKAGVVYRKQYNGRRINICITGVDSRMGSNYKLADANHVLSILIDKGEIEVTSIPRDTYADAGMPDSTNQNTIAVMRAAKGRKAYLRRIAQIAELDTIHYYLEFGFSQAMGIIEWLGYKNSKNTLQVLRSRKVFGGGDWQRTYNQGKFIKQSMIKSFNNFDGIFADLVLMGGLSLTESNMKSGLLSSILKKLKQNGFGKPEDVTLRIRPEFAYKYKNFDFNDEEIIAQMSSKVDSYFDEKYGKDRVSTDSTIIVELDKAITKANHADKTGKPYITISTLNTLFNQKIWLQITDKQARNKYRDKLKNLLVSAYYQKKDTLSAERVNNIIETENNLFKMNKNLTKSNSQSAQEYQN